MTLINFSILIKVFFLLFQIPKWSKTTFEGFFHTLEYWNPIRMTSSSILQQRNICLRNVNFVDKVQKIWKIQLCFCGEMIKRSLLEGIKTLGNNVKLKKWSKTRSNFHEEKLVEVLYIKTSAILVSASSHLMERTKITIIKLSTIEFCWKHWTILI